MKMNLIACVMVVVLLNNGGRALAQNKGAVYKHAENVVIPIDTDGQYAIDEVLEQSSLILRGRAATLRINKLNNQSSIDASGLVVNEVIIGDEINGQCTLIIRDASFTFREVHGESVVIMLAGFRNRPCEVKGTLLANASRIVVFGPLREAKIDNTPDNSRVIEIGR